MLKGIFVCNIYDPRREDFCDNFFKNVKKEKQNELKKIFDSYIKQVEIGDPKPTHKFSKEELLQRNIVGLYTKSDTAKSVFNLFSNDLYDDSNINKKKKKKKNSKEINESFGQEIISDEDIVENLDFKNISEEIGIDVNYNE